MPVLVSVCNFPEDSNCSSYISDEFWEAGNLLLTYSETETSWISDQGSEFSLITPVPSTWSEGFRPDYCRICFSTILKATGQPETPYTDYEILIHDRHDNFIVNFNFVQSDPASTELIFDVYRNNPSTFDIGKIIFRPQSSFVGDIDDYRIEVHVIDFCQIFTPDSTCFPYFDNTFWQDYELISTLDPDPNFGGLDWGGFSWDQVTNIVFSGTTFEAFETYTFYLVPEENSSWYVDFRPEKVRIIVTKSTQTFDGLLTINVKDSDENILFSSNQIAINGTDTTFGIEFDGYNSNSLDNDIYKLEFVLTYESTVFDLSITNILFCGNLSLIQPAGTVNPFNIDYYKNEMTIYWQSSKGANDRIYPGVLEVQAKTNDCELRFYVFAIDESVAGEHFRFGVTTDVIIDSSNYTPTLPGIYSGTDLISNSNQLELKGILNTVLSRWWTYIKITHDQEYLDVIITNKFSDTDLNIKKLEFQVKSGEIYLLGSHNVYNEDKGNFFQFARIILKSNSNFIVNEIKFMRDETSNNFVEFALESDKFHTLEDAINNAVINNLTPSFSNQSLDLNWFTNFDFDFEYRAYLIQTPVQGEFISFSVLGDIELFIYDGNNVLKISKSNYSNVVLISEILQSNFYVVVKNRNMNSVGQLFFQLHTTTTPTNYDLLSSQNSTNVIILPYNEIISRKLSPNSYLTLQKQCNIGEYFAIKIQSTDPTIQITIGTDVYTNIPSEGICISYYCTSPPSVANFIVESNSLEVEIKVEVSKIKLNNPLFITDTDGCLVLQSGKFLDLAPDEVSLDIFPNSVVGVGLDLELGISYSLLGIIDSLEVSDLANLTILQFNPNIKNSINIATLSSINISNPANYNFVRQGSQLIFAFLKLFSSTKSKVKFTLNSIDVNPVIGFDTHELAFQSIGLNILRVINRETIFTKSEVAISPNKFLSIKLVSLGSNRSLNVKIIDKRFQRKLTIVVYNNNNEVTILQSNQNYNNVGESILIQSDPNNNYSNGRLIIGVEDDVNPLNSFIDIIITTPG